ncbi:MAG: TetR family transcriptional regulator [Pseudonocardiales bacterium]|nr:MAG: TetR family transcriptional regulator [Pseudonocardiales bacterium]
MPRVTQDHVDARRRQILDGARTCFARHGFEGATVRRLEDEIGLSRGAIFHHFRDKDSLFLAAAEDDAAEMAAVVARHGLVQVMRNLLRDADPDWLGTQLEVSRRLRTDDDFRDRWEKRAAEIERATRGRLERASDAGTLRDDVDVNVLQRFLALALDGLVLRLATGIPAGDLDPVLDLVEETVRRR